MPDAYLCIHLVAGRPALHSPEVLDDRLEGGLVNRGQTTEAGSKVGEVVANVGFWSMSDSVLLPAVGQCTMQPKAE